MSTKMIEFWVKDVEGRLVMLGRGVVHGSMWRRDDRDVVGRRLGLMGWNYVCIGVDGFYADEGPGLVAGDVLEYVKDDVRREMMLMVRAGVSILGIEVPMVAGYRYVQPRVEETAVSVSASVGVSWDKMTKVELLNECDRMGIDYVGSMTKGQLLELLKKG